MPEAKVLLVIQGEGEHWKTSLLLSQSDAKSCLQLLQTGRDQDRLDLPSVDGFVELQSNRSLLLCYEGRDIIRVDRHFAKNLISEALETAEETDLDEEARTEVWDWVCEQHNPSILNLESGETLEGVLLYRERSYFAVQAADGNVWFAEVWEIYGKIWLGERISLTANATGLVARPGHK